MGGGPRPVWWALKTRRKGHLRVWVPGVARLGPSGVAFYAQRARLPPVSSTARSTFPLPGGICDFAGPSQPARGDLSCGSTGKASASPHQARIKTTRTRHIACGSRTKVEYLDPVVPGPPGRSGVYRYVIILWSTVYELWVARAGSSSRKMDFLAQAREAAQRVQEAAQDAATRVQHAAVAQSPQQKAVNPARTADPTSPVTLLSDVRFGSQNEV